MPHALELRKVDKGFGGRAILDGVSFAAAPGEMLVILGDSGSGKTTTLRLIAGLETPDSGEIWIGGALAAGPNHFTPPEKRQIGMVFQDYALFPHLTAAGNIAFALHREAASARNTRTGALLERVGLTGLGDRFPHQLSGGEQQRVALARALAAEPSLVLLDEPFSNLDASRRKSLRAEVAATLRGLGTTAVFVTHDQDEALQMADRLVVMRAGRVLQAGPPRAVYEAPASREVAAFVGEANFLPGQADGASIETAIGRLALLTALHGPAEVLIRPEMLEVTPNDDGAAVITAVRYYGYDQGVDLRLAGGAAVTARVRADIPLRPHDRADVRVPRPVVAYRC